MPQAKRVHEWVAFKAQTQILTCAKRFIVVPAGRRLGKTELGVAWLLREGQRLVSAGHDPASLELWWVCPKWEITKRAYNKIVKTTKEDGSPNPFRSVFRDKTLTPGNMKIMTRFGFIIHFKSAEIPEQLEGEGIHALVVDEAAAVREAAWLNSLYPALTMTRARALLIGRPKGKNWFWREYLRGLDGSSPEHAGFRFPTSANPHLPREAILEAKRDLPPRVYQEEYEAEALDDSGGVFQNVQACIRGEYAKPEPGERYVVAWDVGRHTDFSAVVVDRVRDKHTVKLERFVRVPYPEQVRRVARIALEYGADVIMDATGAGDPPYEFLVEAIDKAEKTKGEERDARIAAGDPPGPQPPPMRVIPFKYSAGSKTDLINNHISIIGEAAASWPKDAAVLTHEHEVYEWQAGGRSGHPEGDHDDTVQAKALATWYVARYAASRVIEPVDLSDYY